MENGREDHNPWTKWYWTDWRADDGLQACSFAAKGLWMDMLSIMARSKNKGFLLDGEKQMESKTLAKITGSSVEEVERLLNELEEHGVFSRATDGTIYNRRMVREARISRSRSEAGRLGGRPKKQNESKLKAKPKQDVKAPSASASASEYDKKDKKEESREGKEEREGLERAIIDEFNRITGQRRQLTSETRRLLGKLINKGYEFNDFRRVIGFKAWDFSQKEEMRKYIRPATFFAEARFEDYLEQERIWREGKKNRVGEAGRDERQMSKEEWLKWRQTVEREIRRSLGQAGLSKEEIEEKVKEGLSEWERKNKYTGGN